MVGVFLDRQTVDWGDIRMDALQATLPHWQFFDRTTPAERVFRLKNAVVAVTNKVVLDANTLAQCPKLRLICAAATGLDHIDLVAAQAREIVVHRASAYATPSVVQHTISLLLALTGHLPDYLAAARTWPQSPLFCVPQRPPIELAGKTLGIIGYGALGQGVAQVAKALGMIVCVAARDRQDMRPDRVPLEMVLHQSDVISLHCPLIPETKGMMHAEAFAMMKPGSYLINTARGGLIVTDALIHALQSGHLAGAALDVLATEPPLASDPLLQNISNLLITPHIAWASQAARQRLVDQITKTIEGFMR